MSLRYDLNAAQLDKISVVINDDDSALIRPGIWTLRSDQDIYFSRGSAPTGLIDGTFLAAGERVTLEVPVETTYYVTRATANTTATTFTLFVR